LAHGAEEYRAPDLDNSDSVPGPSRDSRVDDLFVRKYCTDLPEHGHYGLMEMPLDLTPPTISQPADINFSEGSTGHSIVWNISDENPRNYTVWMNDTVHTSDAWNSSPMEVTVGLDGLEEGYYIFAIIAVDNYVGVNIDLVAVNVTAARLSEWIPLVAVGAGSVLVVVVVGYVFVRKKKG